MAGQTKRKRTHILNLGSWAGKKKARKSCDHDEAEENVCAE
jgi:hypothetical protein